MQIGFSDCEMNFDIVLSHGIVDDWFFIVM